MEAFDTLFNKRDYAAAERFWPPDYIQHSAHIEPAPTIYRPNTAYRHIGVDLMDREGMIKAFSELDSVTGLVFAAAAGDADHSLSARPLQASGKTNIHRSSAYCASKRNATSEPYRR